MRSGFKWALLLFVALAMIAAIVGTALAERPSSSRAHAPQVMVSGRFRLVINGNVSPGRAISVYQRGIDGQPGYEFCQTMGRDQPAPRCKQKAYSVWFSAVRGRMIRYSYRYYRDGTHYRVFKRGSFRARSGVVVTARYPHK